MVCVEYFKVDTQQGRDCRPGSSSLPPHQQKKVRSPGATPCLICALNATVSPSQVFLFKMPMEKQNNAKWAKTCCCGGLIDVFPSQFNWWSSPKLIKLKLCSTGFQYSCKVREGNTIVEWRVERNVMHIITITNFGTEIFRQELCLTVRC